MEPRRLRPCSLSTRSDGPLPDSRLRWIGLALFLALVALAVVACGAVGTASPGAQRSPGRRDTRRPWRRPRSPEPLAPAAAPTDPIGLVSCLFTPIFQALFILLAELYALTGNVLIAIVLMTLIIRVITMRLSAKTIVSQQRMQRLQPELKAMQKELQRRYKGDRQAIYAAQQAFYKERGVSPTSGCLPSLLQMGMLIPMYSVIRIGLTNFDPSAMLSVFGAKVVPLTCPNPVIS